MTHSSMTTGQALSLLRFGSCSIEAFQKQSCHISRTLKDFRDFTSAIDDMSAHVVRATCHNLSGTQPIYVHAVLSELSETKWPKGHVHAWP